MWVNCQAHFRDAQKALRKTGAITVQKGMNQEQMVNMIAEGIQQAISLKDQKEQQDQAENMVSAEEKSLQQELADMFATIQAIQQNNMQQQHPGQENLPY
eukprot:11503154-Ditylum_brightwellii.AAC.1